MLYTGIDIGGTKCAVVVGNESGIQEKIKFDTVTKEKTLEQIIQAVEKLGAHNAIGISCGGPLDSKKGLILSPPNLPGWDRVPIKDMLEKKFQVPVGIQNDANACALAEWKYGAGKGCQNMIFLTFGTGMGAGLVLDGKLYAGTTDAAGEVGHMRVERSGPVGFGKAGSFEGFCSGGGIAQLGRTYAETMFQQGQAPRFCSKRENVAEITAKSLAEAACGGDTDAQAVYDLVAEKLGVGLSVLIDILNPQRIVIGSVYARSHDLMYEKMQEVVKREALADSAAACRIVPAELGDSIGDYAAISVAQTTYEERM